MVPVVLGALAIGVVSGERPQVHYAGPAGHAHRAPASRGGRRFCGRCLCGYVLEKHPCGSTGGGSCPNRGTPHRDGARPVIEKDRVLLARLAKVNRSLGAVVVELFGHQDGGELPAAGLRVLGELFSGLAADLIARAHELDRDLVILVDGGDCP